MAAVSGNVASIAARKVIAAASAAGLTCEVSPSGRPLAIVVSGARFDDSSANTAATLAIAAGAAVRSPGANQFRSAVADVDLEELLVWDSRIISPAVAALVAFREQRSSGGVAADADWAELKQLRAKSEVG